MTEICYVIKSLSMKLIFIDVDNTLLDYDAYTEKTLRDGFKRFDLGEFNQHVIDTFHKENDLLWREIEKGILTFEELQKIRFNKVFAALNISFDGEVFEAYYREELFSSAIPISHSYEMLEYLKKKGYILAVASNGPYKQQLNRLEIGKMKDYFSYFFISENLGFAKPAKEFFDKAINEIKEDISREEMLIIGDSLTSDMAGGKNAGIKTCLYNKKKVELTNVKVDFVLNDLADISLYL